MPSMSYPPRNAKRPSELGTSAPAKRQVVDRRADPNAAPTSLSTTDRTNRAIHTCIGTAEELWEVIAQAAQAASDDQSTCACKTLWQHLDPPLAGKSAAVKAAVPALRKAMGNGSEELVAYGMWALERIEGLEDQMLGKLAKGKTRLSRVFAM